MIEEKRYQIFISSTYKDLKEARSKVVETILSLYHFPIGMEMFSAADEEQWKVIKDTIEASDYYIVIIGHRYGSETEEGISYTEKEYDYARQQNIPIMTFIRERDVSTKPHERYDNEDKKNKLNDFIQKAKSDKMCDSWETPAELANKVAVALTKIFKRNSQIGWVRADKAISPKVSKEITELSRENRELRNKVKELESKYPNLDILFNDENKLELELELDDNYKPFELEKISCEEVPEHLRDYITQEEIEEYNDNLPSEDEIKEYSNKRKRYYIIQNSYEILDLSVVNEGSLKANEIHIEMEFPDSLLVMRKRKFEELSPPQLPDFPRNPIEEAKKEYKESTGLSISQLIDTNFLGMGQISDVYDQELIHNISGVNQRYTCRVEENEVQIWIEDLLHTRVQTFEDDVVVVPLDKGEYKIKVNVICEEYEEQDIFYMPVKIK